MYNTVLLPPIVAHRQSKDGRTWVPDASILPFLLEELISLGVVDIASGERWRWENVVKSMPAPMRKRFVLSDSAGEYYKRMLFIIAPIMAELDVEEIEHHGWSSKPTIDKEAFRALWCLRILADYLFALEQKLCVQVNVHALTSSIHLLRSKCRSPEARANLATLQGLLVSYDETSLGAVIVRSSAKGRIVDLFEDLTADGTYRQMSRQAYLLGFPAEFQKARRKLNRSARTLVAKPLFKPLVDLGSRILSACTSLPVPDSELAEALLQQKYLPPVVSLENAIVRAMAEWRKVNPDFIPTVGSNGLESFEPGDIV